MRQATRKPECGKRHESPSAGKRHESRSVGTSAKSCFLSRRSGITVLRSGFCARFFVLRVPWKDRTRRKIDPDGRNDDGQDRSVRCVIALAG